MALKPKTAPALVTYVVLVEPTNGMRIAGKRRTKGETFAAAPAHMAFLVREGVVAPQGEAAAG